MTDQKTVLTKPTQEDFLKAFRELSEKMGYQLVAVPLFIPRDDGTFSLKIQWQVSVLPQIDKSDLPA